MSLSRLLKVALAVTLGLVLGLGVSAWQAGGLPAPLAERVPASLTDRLPASLVERVPALAGLAGAPEAAADSVPAEPDPEVLAEEMAADSAEQFLRAAMRRTRAAVGSVASAVSDALHSDAAAEPTAEKPPITLVDVTRPRIVVSIDKRWLWYIVEQDTILSVPVAVGMNRGFSFAGKSFHFSTPRGRRTVLRKEENPIWTVPEWHYYERARHQDLEVVHLQEDSRVDLSDGTVLVVQDGQVGRINHFGNFWPFTPGNEIIWDGKVFVPPLSTPQRRVPEALGPYKLDTGNGYLIHGTHIYNEESVGNAVSHGCVRMNNDDLERLYHMVEPGTPVYIR